MIWQQMRVALLAGGIVAATALTARADDCCAPAPCAPQYRTVCVHEWVPENYTTTRTVYTRECKQENYTAYRCECVPETRTRTCTTYKMVPEVQTVVHKVCVCVPCVEERTVMQTHVTCKPVTHMVRRCVDRGHYECCEVPCGPTFRERFHRLFHKHRHGCCEDSCCDSCEPCCVRTKTVRRWVSCPTWEECPVTCYERVCESRPVVCKVTTYKHEMREEKCQVTCCKCVPETHTENYTCMVRRMVPCQATRTVVCCVPHQETVTCCRMVCRTVQKQVPCQPCCSTSCCENSCCENSCCHSRCHHRLCSGLSFRGHHGCCD